jgi:opacity protein-like surface antigen
LAGAAYAAEQADTGFYGGISLRDRGSDAVGLQTTTVTAPASGVANWTWLNTPAADETSTRALVFGGYRVRNDVAVEASFSSVDKYALRPADVGSTLRGVGLGLHGVAPGFGDVSARSWNVDVYTSWAFYRAFSLYGRLGYAQADVAPYGTGFTNGADSRRARDGVNYGVGLRYNVNSALGLRLEYARFARFGTETGGLLPDSDQVSFGVQFRF